MMAMTMKLRSQELHKELEAILTDTSKAKIGIHKVIYRCREVLSDFRKQIVTDGFRNTAEEIDFFKNIKIIPASRLIYYNEIHKFENLYPKSDRILQEQFIKQNQKSYNRFFLRNIDFGQYIEMGSTHFDEHYFTRKFNEKLPLTITKFFNQDIEFTTPKDTLLAEFKAYNLMIRYLKNKLVLLKNENRDMMNHQKFKLHFKGAKTDIVELVYALIASGKIEGDIKELISAFEFILGIELGDFYRIFISIRGRTIDPTKFIDTLKMALLKRIEEADN